MDSVTDRQWHHLEAADAVRALGTDRERGLDLFEVQRRQEEFGPNAISRVKGAGPLRRFLLQFHQPLIYILLVSGLIATALGEHVDSLVILGVVLVNAVVGYLQEAKAVGALEALARSMVTEATVVRAGQSRRVDAKALVPGDLVVLRSGDKAPADMRLVSVKNLQVDESALTGESLPVEKGERALPLDTLLADRGNMAYASTVVTYGQAAGIVVSTGDRTEIGRISGLVAGAESLDTPLTRKIEAFSRILLWGILALAAVTFFAGIMKGESVPDMFMAAVALTVGAIPEGLPAAVTVILAMGVSRMAARGAIIRKLPAVETLGATTVVCSDKTGTLTQNQMTVVEIRSGGRVRAVSGSGYEAGGAVEGVAQGFADGAGNGVDGRDEALRETLLAGILCNETIIEAGELGVTVSGDPTEAALLVAASKAGLDRAAQSARLPRLDTLPFESQHQYMATLHGRGDGAPPVVYFKGSVEALLQRVSDSMAGDGGRLPADAARIQAEAEDMASRGLRVLAMAEKELPQGTRTLDHADVASGMTFLGLQGMIDPPRPEAVDAVKTLHRAGVRVKMITGDHALTAAAIGRMLGMGGSEDGCPPRCRTLTGAEVAAMGDAELVEAVRDVDVFARVAPEQKLRLVMALQNQGEIAAMTGDGVNDAPALKQADIGVAMGRGGTEAAKEAADMILTDDNFATIEAAVEEGRGVYDNLLKFIVWTLPTNLGEGLVILVSVILGGALPILPVQILWINMTTAGALGLTLAFEPKEPGIMERRPREADHPILDRELVIRIVLVGGILLLAAFGLYRWELAASHSEAQARTVAVNVFVMVEAFYLFNSRSFTLSPFALGFGGNVWLLGGFALMMALQLLFTYAPFMNVMFGSAPVDLLSWAKAAAVGALSFLVVEFEKRLRRA
ncbi:ATPase, P-type (transporting), HAD superfamily, subfamily IC [Desulfovibrio sp. X2]|uniref:cation-transporting P-type ATPase n=1 Tax=Desulfovibrio sp. X2 TaxID=941449 RepID=UPI0003588DEC|nr:cation-transporting P-type ATPase [Desulfovibrio sp. X2]EPR42157.1 ATPase, P-type (transporting), HAD superfamily, subfamily IC [Desulfovibrio sp. X2]